MAAAGPVGRRNAARILPFDDESRPMNRNAFHRVRARRRRARDRRRRAGAGAQPAAATDWPKGPVHIVVPYGPGSTPDIIARIVGDKLAKRTGQPIIVDNKPGAAGNLGTDAIAKAAPDGQTIGVSIAGPLGVNALLFKKMPYDPAKDLELVSIAATQPSVLVVPSTLGVGQHRRARRADEEEPGQVQLRVDGRRHDLASGDGSARDEERHERRARARTPARARR